MQGYLRSKFPGDRATRLRPLVAQLNTGQRSSLRTGFYWWQALLLHVEERYGLGKVGEIMRTLTDVAPEQPLPVAEAFASAIGKPLEEIEDECAKLLGVTLVAEPPRPVVRTVASTRVPAFVQARGAILRRDYASALNGLLPALAAPGGAYSAKEWADLHYGAGFALDQLGHRQSAIDHYERALVWAEPESSLYAELESGLVQRRTRFRYQARTTHRAAANRPVDLHQDERNFSAVVRGGTHERFPYLLDTNHFADTTPEDKARIAEEQLQVLRTVPDGEPRWRAMEILGLLQERRALPLLHRYVLERGTAMGYCQCMVAARALYRIADRQSIPFLVKATSSINMNTRAGAFCALQKLTGQRFRTPREWERWQIDQRPANTLAERLRRMRERRELQLRR